jgi:hypothetical protein
MVPVSGRLGGRLAGRGLFLAVLWWRERRLTRHARVFFHLGALSPENWPRTHNNGTSYAVVALFRGAILALTQIRWRLVWILSRTE